MPIQVRVYDHVVVVTGARTSPEADNAAADHTGIPVERFRRAARVYRYDTIEQEHLWKYVLV